MRTLLALLLLSACGPDVAVSKVPVDADHDDYDSTVDCDDGHANVNPEATEVCDGLDNDCNGVVDDDVADGFVWYPDADGDGYGDDADAIVSCDAPGGYVADGTDCDDAEAVVNPAASEVCDGLDNDCNALVDDDALDATETWLDADGDGHGNPAVSFLECEVTGGHVTVSDDCDDAAAGVNPDAAEVCDDAGVDEDCDGLVNDADPSVGGAGAWYADADGDGYGGDATTLACAQPDGYVATSEDCDDGAAAINPGASEVCDRADTDEDCDGLADDADASTAAAGMTTWYADRDGDTYGDARATVLACDLPSGYGTDATDCDDLAATTNPAAAEVCDDAVDNDCDGTVDEDCAPVDTGDTGGEPAVCDGANTGDTYSDGTSMGGPGLLLGMQYTPTADMDIGAIEVYTGEQTGTNTVGIWSDDPVYHQPDVDLGTGSWSMDTTDGWQGADLPTCLTLTAGTTYWVVWAPINGAQATWDNSGTSVSYRGSFDGGATWNGPYSGYLKYKLYCCE